MLELPPTSVEGFRDNDPRRGMTVILSVLVTPAKFAEIVTLLLAVTVFVVTIKDALVAPAGIVNKEGT